LNVPSAICFFLVIGDARFTYLYYRQSFERLNIPTLFCSTTYLYTKSIMARFSLFSLTIFLVFAAIALSLPTKRDDAQGLTLENAFQGLKVGLP
jgi:hypothetical protein